LGENREILREHSRARRVGPPFIHFNWQPLTNVFEQSLCRICRHNRRRRRGFWTDSGLVCFYADCPVHDYTHLPHDTTATTFMPLMTFMPLTIFMPLRRLWSLRCPFLMLRWWM
jgi:hypothetical protein